MRDLLAPLLVPGTRVLDPLIGREAGSLNTRSNLWQLLAIGAGFILVALSVVAPLSGGVGNTVLQLAALGALVFALFRSLWLSHRAAEAANRYLIAKLGFPVRSFFAPITPAQWRKRIAREAERHNKSR